MRKVFMALDQNVRTLFAFWLIVTLLAGIAAITDHVMQYGFQSKASAEAQAKGENR